MTADQEDMLAVLVLRDECGCQKRQWSLICLGDCFRCIIAGREETRADAATIKQAVFGALRAAGIVGD